MSTTPRESISRVRAGIKATNEDAFITDRYIYSLLMKYAKHLIKRDWDTKHLFKHSSLFKEDSCVELIEVSVIPDCCKELAYSNCRIMRSKNKLPKMLELTKGNLIRNVSTLDYSKRADVTVPLLYANMKKSVNFKYNPSKYYWYLEGYLYIPDVDWEAVRVEALFEDNISSLSCNSEEDMCMMAQDKTMVVPEGLFAEIEQLVRTELQGPLTIPGNNADDAQNISR